MQLSNVLIRVVMGASLPLVLIACPGHAAFAQRQVSLRWNEILKQSPTWYASSEALQVADNFLLYQRNSGGWPKNIDMTRALTEREIARVIALKNTSDSTIDNGATFTQLAFLARVFTQQQHPRHRDSFEKGLDYLLKAQYDNGGWPQFYPDRKGYQRYVTFNDGAMIGVLKVLRDVAQAKPDYLFVDEKRRANAAAAVAKGIDCILKTQVVIKGRRTVWCAQYEELTLRPASARKYELVSLSGLESVEIVRFLMSIQNPSSEVIDAVEGAVAWFQESQLNGIRWLEKSDGVKSDWVVVMDRNAPPIWARFYEIGTNRPIFVGRDGVVKYEVAAIDYERRNNYAWYAEEPGKLLARDYPQWRTKNGR